METDPTPNSNPNYVSEFDSSKFPTIDDIQSIDLINDLGFDDSNFDLENLDLSLLDSYLFNDDHAHHGCGIEDLDDLNEIQVSNPNFDDVLDHNFMFGGSESSNLSQIGSLNANYGSNDVETNNLNINCETRGSVRSNLSNLSKNGVQDSDIGGLNHNFGCGDVEMNAIDSSVFEIVVADINLKQIGHGNDEINISNPCYLNSGSEQLENGVHVSNHNSGFGSSDLSNLSETRDRTLHFGTNPDCGIEASLSEKNGTEMTMALLKSSPNSPNCGSCDLDGGNGCKGFRSALSSSGSVVACNGSGSNLSVSDDSKVYLNSNAIVYDNNFEINHCDGESSEGSNNNNDHNVSRNGYTHVTDSPNSCNERVYLSVNDNGDGIDIEIEEKVILGEDKKRASLKRKKGNEDERNGSGNKSNVISNGNRGSVKGSKFLLSDDNNNGNVGGSGGEGEMDDKKKARLIRNRESAHLSRQKKKQYVEELEDKVKSMHAMITDLNSRISYVIAENSSLRQQLVGAPPPGMGYPPPGIGGPIHYPWAPYGQYPMKSGSHVPLIPIPRLKPQQPTPAPKKKKTESKKSEGRPKKVASISFLGLLFFMLLFGGLVPLVNVKYGEKKEAVLNGLGSDGHPRGRILTVNGMNGSGSRDGVGVGRTNCEQKDGNGLTEGCAHSGNSSEPLLASLYVPRNDKLVKIDGNLIIHSVLASERAEAVKDPKASSSNSKETGLAIPSHVRPALATGEQNVDGHSRMYRNPSDRQKAIGPGPGDTYKDKLKTSSSDGSLQKWFREGLGGPIFSSNVCTEVFQFVTSPESGSHNSIIPATVTNISAKGSVNTKINRRILNRLPPIPLPGSDFNRSSAKNKSINDSKAVSSSMVVSVLVDPKDAEGNDVDGVISPPKSFSRIFVVVLIDSVKYVTYSCMLPLKGSSGPHLVTT